MNNNDTHRIVACMLAVAFVCAVRAHGAVSLLVDDFNTARTVNKVGGNTGCWSCNPQDINQFCDATFVSDTKVGGVGYALRLDYNQNTPNNYIPGLPQVAFNGYFSDLKQKKLTPYKYFIINVKGDPERGYTRSLTVQLKNKTQTGSYTLQGINGEWQRYVVPFESFIGITDWYYIKELDIVFNENTNRRDGAVYVDDISFTDSPYPKSTVANYVKPAKTGRAIIIDGDLKDWKHERVIEVNAKDDCESGVIVDPKKNTAQFSFLWDNEYLYFSATVTDQDMVCRKTGADIGYDDCVDLFVGPMGGDIAYNETDFFHFGFTPSGPEGKPQVWEWRSNSEPSESDLPLAAHITQVKGTTQYQIEGAISWNYLKITPQDNMCLGVCPGVHTFNTKDETNGKYSWYFLREGDKAVLGKMTLNK